MDTLVERLNGAWRIGALTYGLRVAELVVNGVYSVTGNRWRQLADLDSAGIEGRGRLAVVTGANAGASQVGSAGM